MHSDLQSLTSCFWLLASSFWILASGSWPLIWVTMINRDDITDAIEITLVPGVGSLLQNRIWKEHREGSAIFDRKEADLGNLGVPAEAQAALKSRRYRAIASEIRDWADHERCRIIVHMSLGYPALLEEIHDPPLVLYAKGSEESLSSQSLSIVGTRKPTIYGLQMAEGIASDLARRGITIVSGLARGIDAAAHRGALAAAGPTIAVLGCGIDVIYPPEHRHLSGKILASGAVLTEFPPGTPPSPQNFPIRNRIISGLSLGTMIVEASEYSGSLITARLAMEQNREVFAIPGNITSPQSFGPNFLIKQGAKLVQCWRDVVEELPPDLRHQILAREEHRPAVTAELELMTPEETKVLAILETDAAVQFDKIHFGSGIAVPALLNVLLNLEMKGRIRQIPGNLYIKIARPPDVMAQAR